MTKYPTPEEIMAHAPKYPVRVITDFKTWKKELWSLAKHKSTKFGLLGALLLRLSEIYKKPLKDILLGKRYQYQNGVITLTSKPSVISALHEFGHHLYGPSELKACRFSVHLFKMVFPEARAHLSWKGHMLIRKRKTMKK